MDRTSVIRRCYLIGQESKLLLKALRLREFIEEITQVVVRLIPIRLRGVIRHFFLTRGSTLTSYDRFKPYEMLFNPPTEETLFPI